MTAASTLPEPMATGALGACQLPRIWAAHVADGAVARPGEWALDQIVLCGLNLALEETLVHLATTRPTLSDFEAWVLERNGGRLDPSTIARLNAAVARAFGPDAPPAPPERAATGPSVLSAADHAHFVEHGYVVVREAVERRQALAAADALCRHVGIDPAEPETWYERRAPGIMLQLFHHPALAANRASARVRGAFADVYGSDDLWMTVDRISFNPPERDGWRFPGPHLHWDADFSARPMSLRTQGILYLTDTPAHQGAFACVPGFHRRIDAWLADRASDGYPQGYELGNIAPTPIPGEAGDLVIWHQALPHAATPNAGSRPRLVHYVNMLPTPRVAVANAAP